MESTTSGSEIGSVIVGVDGSESARHAALWAAVEAVHRERALHIVYAVDTDGREAYVSEAGIERARGCPSQSLAAHAAGVERPAVRRERRDHGRRLGGNGRRAGSSLGRGGESDPSGVPLPDRSAGRGEERFRGRRSGRGLAARGPAGDGWPAVARLHRTHSRAGDAQSGAPRPLSRAAHSAARP